MDTSRFAININPQRSGLATTVKSQLLGWGEERNILLEPYKLNVYGEGSFFKAHKDTPRSERMFGSLVVVLPTPHQGGGLLLRHDGKETLFDSGKELYGKPPGTVAFVAFYSDVEHEVQKVVSGHRVTITYNLYFVEKLPTLPEPRKLLLDTEYLTEALKQQLARDDFLPKGGLLGFGLKHQYPLPSKDVKATDLEAILDYLKGADEAVLRACTSLDLKPSFKIVYVTRGQWDRGNRYVMCDGTLDCQGEVEDVVSELEKRRGGEVIWNDKGTYDHQKKEWKTFVSWITPMKSTTFLSEGYLAYGNQASFAHLYGDVSLIVYVGAPGQRQDPSSIEPFEFKTDFKTLFIAGPEPTMKPKHWF